ncbi:MAG: hypothetical protein K6E51_09615 [Treponema sp.]|nr:hypothetical protein [Treponema sp.]
MNVIKKSCCLCLFSILISAYTLYAQAPESVTAGEDDTQSEEPVDQLLSFDFLLLFNQLTNQGFGLGGQLERQIVPHFSYRMYLGSAVFNTLYESYYCTTLTLSFFGHYYPFSRQLLGYYVCMGDSFDFLGYFGNGQMSKDNNGYVLSLEFQSGYKFNLPLGLIFDIFLGYKIGLSAEGEIFGTAESYLNRGIRYGLGFRKSL